MRGPEPVVDPRRSAELAAELEARARSWIPEWHSTGAAGDFGSAVLRIAARFGAEVTQRLDRFPDKAGADLLDWLRITGRPGQAARMAVVLRMAATSRDGVDVPAGVRLQAQAGDAAIDFETLQALTLLPSPLAAMVAVDPGRDMLRYPPPQVLSLDPPVPGPRAWTLQSLAPAGARMLQLSPALGLAPGTVVEAAGVQYTIDAAPAGGLTSIAAPVAAGGIGIEEPVNMVTAFQPFHGNGRDMQEHRLYIGDDNLLNLGAPARIALSGPGGETLLAGDFCWDYWGGEAPDWHVLTLEATAGRVLFKNDERPLQLLEVGGHTSRWIRATPKAPLGQDSMTLGSVRVAINPTRIENPPGAPMPQLEGVANNVSVPLGPDPFYPLGKVPRQFDAFYLACPEVFSKPGAVAVLKLEMAEPTLGPLVAVPFPNPGPWCVFAIGADGALHRHTWNEDATRNWQALGPTRPTAALFKDASHFKAIDGAIAPAVSVVAGQAQVFIWSANQVWMWQELLQTNAAPGSWWYIDAIENTVIRQLVLLGAGTSSLTLVALVDADNGRKAVHTARLAPVLNRERLDQTVPWIHDDWAQVAPVLDAASSAAHATLADTFYAVTAAGVLFRCTGTNNTFTPEVVTRAGPFASEHAPLVAKTDSATWLIGKGAGSADVLRVLKDGAAQPDIALRGKLIGTRFTAQANPLTVFMALANGGQTQIAWWQPDAPDVTHAPGPERTGKMPQHGPTLAGADLILPGTSLDVLVAPFVTLQPVTFEVGIERWQNRLLADQSVSDDDLVEITPGVLVPLGAPVWVGPPDTLYMFDQPVSKSPLPVFSVNEEPFFAGLEGSSLTALKLEPGAPKVEQGNLLVITYTIGGTTTTVVRTVSEEPGETVKIKPKLATSARGQRLGCRVHAAPDGAVHVRPVLFIDGLKIDGQDAQAVLQPGRPLHFPDPVKPRQLSVKAVVADAVRPFALLDQAWSQSPVDSTTIRIERSAAKWKRFANDVTSNPDLSWEYWNGVGWWKIATLRDETRNLKASGELTFPVPANLAPTEVLGRNSYWIRARLVGGDFGHERFIITPPTSGAAQQQSVIINLDDVHAPLVISLTISYSIETPTPPTWLLTRDNGAWRDQSAANRSADAVIEAFVPARALGDRPALYLAFSRPVCGSQVRILFLADDAQLDDYAPLQVEALRDGRFEAVTVLDQTRALGETGLLTLALANPPTESDLFGRPGYWLRLLPRERSPASGWRPSLRGVYANAVWADAAQTQAMEILGSSTGAPAQQYLLSRFPLLGDSLELRVREVLGDEEIAALNGASADTVRSGVAGFPGHWVRWREVLDPGDEDTDARVFGLDIATGAIRFGDGVHGAVPPAGQDAVVAFGYRHGGAAAANGVGEFAKLNLSTPIRGVESVFAPEGAAGGADPEEDAAVRRGAAARLRGRARAVTLRDLEDLARIASADVAQARALQQPGGVRLVLVARGSDPQPGQALRRIVLARLLQQSGPASVRRLQVPPRLDLVVFRIALLLDVVDLDVGGALALRVRTALTALFDHAGGGADGLGWPIGRAPTDGDVAAQLVVLDGLVGIAGVEFTRVAGDKVTGATLPVAPGQLAILAPDGVKITLLPLEPAS